MWTLAALLSAQFQHLQDFLHHETKQMLESLSLSGDGSQVPFDTEQVQAWILVATYESMRSWHRLAWMSAGRAFRLVQLMRLHEIDLPTRDSISETDLVETEEKRRVFWMAYFLDHLFSMRNNWPITLNEHVVSISWCYNLRSIPDSLEYHRYVRACQDLMQSSKVDNL